MNTHTSSGNRRTLALVSIYASLCSVFALQLAIHATAATDALTASVSSTQVSALVGEHGITMEDLRTYQTRGDARVARARMRHAAAMDKHTVKLRQARDRR